MSDSTYQNNLSLIAKLLVLITFIFCGYFSDGNLSNQNAKINSIFATVEKNPDLPFFAIDLYVNQKYSNSLDWSNYNDHYYSNKAPGSLLFGAPVYFVLKNIEELIDLDTTFGGMQIFNVYLINLVITVIPLALAIGCFFFVLINIGASLRRATILSLLLIFCLPLTSYSTILWSHGSAAACLIFSLFFYQSAQSSTQSNSWKLMLCGLMLSLATVFDYLAIIPSFIMFLIACFQFRLQAFRLVIGALPGMVLFFGYHYYCFDSIFATSLTYTNPVFKEEEKVLNSLTWPNLEVLGYLFIGRYRGIITQFPIVAISLLGFFYWIKSRNQKWLRIFALLTIIFFYLINSAFNGWHAGANVVSRYTICILSLWILSWNYLPRRIILFSIPLIILSALNNFFIISTSSLAPDEHTNPLYGFVYRNFFQENINFLKKPILLQKYDPTFNEYKDLAAFNWGNLMGLEGFFSLLPLLFLLGLLLVKLFLLTKKHA